MTATTIIIVITLMTAIREWRRDRLFVELPHAERFMTFIYDLGVILVHLVTIWIMMFVTFHEIVTVSELGLVTINYDVQNQSSKKITGG